jgi:hypothetical protein
MASILKFDSWQNSAGVNQQAILQTKWARYNTAVSINTTTVTKCFDFPSITRTQAGSMFLILINCQIGYTTSVAGNPDVENPGLAIYRDGSPVSTGSGWGTGFFWGCDVPLTGAGTYGGRYDSQNKNWQFTEVPSGAVGTTFQYALYGNGQPLNVNRTGESSSHNWNPSTVTIFEIAQ